MFPESNSSKSIIPSCLPHGLLFIVFLAVDIQVVVVNSKPLSIPAQAQESVSHRVISQRPPYDGIFRIHALNLSSAEAQDQTRLNDDKSSSKRYQPYSSDPPNSAGSNEYLTPTDFTEFDDQSLREENATYSLLEDGENFQTDYQTSIVTSPRIEVVTKTINGNTNNAFQTNNDHVGSDQGTLSPLREVSNHLVRDSYPQENGEALESGNESSTVEASSEMDIFDNLMSTIHDHWLDFVGKMKLSVLDVWRSISNHMMDRLENFATNL